MKKTINILFLLIALALTADAQELTIKSFAASPSDISALSYSRDDLNGKKCAIVKVQFVGDIVKVEGNTIGDLRKGGNETWVYMTQRSRQMQIVTKDYLPVMINFEDYGVPALESGTTYVLVLSQPQTGGVAQKQTLTICYLPKDATVLVDNKLVKGSSGVASVSLPIGSHQYIVYCEGYESDEGTVKLKASAPTNIQISLSKETLVVQTPVVSQQQQSSVVAQVPPQQQAVVAQVPQPVANTNSANQTFTVNGVAFDMIYVQGGTFTMGGTSEQGLEVAINELPIHGVILSDYYIGKTEVTQALWKAVMGNNPSNLKGDNLPVEKVSWNDCQEFIVKLNELTGKTFRLPTEAEWEYSCKGGCKRKMLGYTYSGSNNINDVAWYGGNSSSKTHPVATKSPNELGIYDMSGNVYEWCSDWYDFYTHIAQVNPIGPTDDSYPFCVIRGGSIECPTKDCRASSRNSRKPTGSYGDIGLRLALSK